MKNYETVIGLEVHVELATKSKAFCSCSIEFGGEPNTHCCPICTGMPGALPVLNKQVVDYAIAAGLALNCTISKVCKFDRKNYFYPDLPKSYQISQLYHPLCRDGSIEIESSEGKKIIGIHEIHMEEDAGKLIHDSTENSTLVDYNRSGVPLIEIVSEADMRTKEEAIAYLKKLRLILQYLGVSGCKMAEGSFRVDINLSVRLKGLTKLGTRTEMKNMNSFKAIARAIEAEEKRQIELLENGKSVVQETRRWDDSKNTSFSMRTKENASDYRYFPEPDIPPIEISEQWLHIIRERQPELRDEKMVRYANEYDIPTFDAAIITESKFMAQFFEDTVVLGSNPKEVANWLIIDFMRLLREEEMDIEDISFTPKQLSDLIHMIEEATINRTIAKEVFEKIFKDNVDPKEYVEKQGLLMVSDNELIRENVLEVFAKNEKSVMDYKNGKTKAMGFLIGQSMKAMEGKADPSLVTEIVKDMLNK
ncbi:MAG TPA: Asp-tRNA(Asn)/Glu-tRNA(Gln) amidotransferase subunit GatB [Clostridiales bacterium]|nr:Asp-tRNA(Asn)/Glu-tRNA(Gln) amidotransferase subunit GatB [Clostridiales bacterium]